MTALLPLLLASAATWPSVSTPATPFSLGANDAAVVAGVAKPFVLPAIPGAADNATDWYRWLVDARGVPAERVRLLRDVDVTKETLLAETAAMRARVGPGGTLWIVFVGHGAPHPDGDDGLLLGVDVQPTMRSIVDRGLAQSELLRTAATGIVKGAHVVALFDACFSGVASDGSRRPLLAGAQATLPVRRGEPPVSVSVLSSSEQVAGPLPRHDRPAFSYLVLGAARGWGDGNGDAVVTLGEAVDYSARVLATTITDRNQSPSLRGDGHVVLAARATERGPDVVEQLAGPVRADARPGAPTSAATFDVVAAQAELNRVRLSSTSDGFVRGTLGEKVSIDRAVAMADGTAPAAVAVIEEIDGMRSTATMTGVLSLVLLAPAGAVAGGWLGGRNGDVGALLVGTGVGALAGTAAGGVSWLVAGMVLGPSPADVTRLATAKDELAEAINDAERRRLGLPTHR